MRYVMWSGDTSIGIPRIDQNRDRLITVRSGWRAALSDLWLKLAALPQDARISAFEINCHGHPACLFMPNGNVDYTNVAEFGTILRPMMMRGALIELLACCVASIGRLPHDDEARELQRCSPAVQAATHEYWDAVEKDAGYLQSDNTVARPADFLDADRLAARTKRVEQMRTLQLPAEGNGLEFCLTMARTSGARVRAAWVSQWEENTQFGGAFTRDLDRFGKWEGPVWDFLPSGTVKYLGFNPPRDKLMYPEQHIGPQLTLNSRGQGALHDGSLRPQRLDRAPLAV